MLALFKFCEKISIGHIWQNYNVSKIFNMAAVAILNFYSDDCYMGHMAIPTTSSRWEVQSSVSNFTSIRWLLLDLSQFFYFVIVHYIKWV